MPTFPADAGGLNSGPPVCTVSVSGFLWLENEEQSSLHQEHARIIYLGAESKYNWRQLILYYINLTIFAITPCETSEVYEFFKLYLLNSAYFSFQAFAFQVRLNYRLSSILVSNP